MIIDQQSILGRLSRRFRLMWVMTAVGLFVLGAGRAWTLGADVAGDSKSNSGPLADQTLAGSEGHFAADSIGPSSVPCWFDPACVSDGMDDPGSSVGEASSQSTAGSLSTEDEKERLKVNPVTGLAVASQANYTPLNGTERWKLYLKMTYASPGPYLSPVVTALLLDQANGTPRQWGGGLPGFGRRLASRAGNAVLQGSFQAPLAALLHEDVRYIPTTQHSFQRRALHAVLYSFLTYNNKGHTTLNVANLTAYYASTAVTTAWLPGIGNAAKYTFVNASEQIGLSFPLNVVQEFWPEIRRHLFRRP